MKRNKKGFTLIELLAVLVVLAILALIAVPIVLNIINQSRERAHLRSVEGFAKAVESAVYTYATDNSTVSFTDIGLHESSAGSGTYTVYAVDSNSAVIGTAISVQYSGDLVKNCTLDATTNKVKLTGCTVGNSDDTIVYENGQADFEEEE